MKETNPTVSGRAGAIAGSSDVTPGGGTAKGPKNMGAGAPTGAGKAPSIGYHTINPGRGNGAPVTGGQPEKGPTKHPTPRGVV